MRVINNCIIVLVQERVRGTMFELWYIHLLILVSPPPPPFPRIHQHYDYHR